MTFFKFTRTAAIMAILMAAVCNCQKPDDGQEGTGSTEKINFFTYEGYSFDINSVVKYDQGDNSVELWLSPKSGATTIAEIESEGDYVVLNTHSSYLGSRDRFSASASKNSYIRFGESQEFSYGDAGTAYIMAAIEGDQITVEFLTQKLYTKAEEIKAALQGSYKGSFTTQTEQPYNNEWGINRNRESLKNAIYTTYEDGSNSLISLYSESSSEAFRLCISPSLVGKSITLPYNGSSSNLSLVYSGAIEFNLAKATGTISTSMNNGQMEVNIDIINADKRFRAVYNGAYAEEDVKLNRFIYNNAGTSLFENGTYEIVKLMVENNGTTCKFFLSPSEGYTISGSNSTHMPILTVPAEIINAGKKSFMELKDWKFEFVEMQVWPYEDEYRPHPSYSDWIEIKKEGNNYQLEFVLSSIATGMAESHIDAHYKGQAK
jgi:hypothetical protein